MTSRAAASKALLQQNSVQREIDRALAVGQERHAIRIQAAMRRRIVMRTMGVVKSVCVLLQSAARARLARKHVHNHPKRLAVMRIQALVRGTLMRRRLGHVFHELHKHRQVMIIRDALIAARINNRKKLITAAVHQHFPDCLHRRADMLVDALRANLRNKRSREALKAVHAKIEEMRAERAASRALLSEGYDWRAALRNAKVWEEGEQQIVVAEKIGGFVISEKIGGFVRPDKIGGFVIPEKIGGFVSPEKIGGFVSPEKAKAAAVVEIASSLGKGGSAVPSSATTDSAASGSTIKGEAKLFERDGERPLRSLRFSGALTTAMSSKANPDVSPLGIRKWAATPVDVTGAGSAELSVDSFVSSCEGDGSLRSVSLHSPRGRARVERHSWHGTSHPSSRPSSRPTNSSRPSSTRSRWPVVVRRWCRGSSRRTLSASPS